MPQIPQGEFNTTPSTNVGAANVRNMPNGIDAMTKAASNLAGAMAQLEDQKERTEAYQVANDVKREYLQKRMAHESALKVADSNGNYRYQDPLDDNPDPTKRKWIEGNVNDTYKDMVTTFNSGQEKVKGITRRDIGEELLRQYVGDDLIEVKLKTNNSINSKKQKALEETAIENIQLLSIGISDSVSYNDSDDVIASKVAYNSRKIDSEMQAMRPVLGEEGYQNLKKAKDRYLSEAAAHLMKDGVSNATVTAANGLISRIESPGQRALAGSRLERIKKATVMQKNVTLMNSKEDVMQKIRTSASLDDKSYLHAIQTAKNLSNMYVNPAYGGFTREQANSAAAEIMSTAIAKRAIQKNILIDDMSFLGESKGKEQADIPFAEGMMRAPSGGQEEDLKQMIATEMEESGLSKLAGDLTNKVVSDSITNMKSMYADARKNLPEILRQEYPTLQGREFYDKLAATYELQGFGEVASFVERKDVTAFKNDFVSNIAKNPMQAVQMFNDTMNKAGEAYEGTKSYRRALAIDLADKNTDMAYIIPMADADPAMQFEMATAAREFETQKKELGVKPKQLHDAFMNNADFSGFTSLQDTSFYDGVKQAVYHETLQGMKRGESISSAMKQASDKFKKLYSVYGTTDGRNVVIGMNKGNATDFSGKKQEIGYGIEKALTLPTLSRQDKIAVLKRSGSAAVVSDTTPDEHIDFLLSRTVTIQPDERYPNVNKVMVGRSPAIKADGRTIEFTTQQILEFGQGEATNRRKGFKPEGYK